MHEQQMWAVSNGGGEGGQSSSYGPQQQLPALILQAHPLKRNKKVVESVFLFHCFRNDLSAVFCKLQATKS